MKKIAILSPPKTGTTALYYKILNSLTDKRVAGLFEPQIYQEPEDKNYHYLLTKVLVDKDSLIDFSLFSDFEHCIYLARDPRDWLVSKILFEMRSEKIASNLEAKRLIVQVLKQKENNPAEVSLCFIIDILAKAYNTQASKLFMWVRNQYFWLEGFEQYFKDCFTLHYENLVDDKLSDLEAYLELALHKGDAQVSDSFSHVPRTKSYGNWRDWFTHEDIETFKPLFKNYMQRHHYPDDWLLNKHAKIKPEHCSEYVTRTMKTNGTELK